MESARKTTVLVSIVLLFGFTMTVANEEVYLKLEGIPERITMPPPEGSNWIITATAIGEAPKSAWLATDKDAQLRCMLSRVSTLKFQINLAEPDCVALLKMSGETGYFKIFVETDEETLLESIPLSYTFKKRIHVRPRCHVYVKKNGEPSHIAKVSERWFDTGTVEKLELRAEPESRIEVARARAGDKSWEFTSTRDNDLLQLILKPDIQKEWGTNGELNVEYQKDGHWENVATFKSVPEKLKLPGNAALMTISQRGIAAIPGSRQSFMVHLGDITAGQVILELFNRDGTRLIEKTSVREGDTIPFTLKGGEYVLYIKRLVNILIGEDWAEIVVSSPLRSSELRKIEALLDRIALSPVTFIREEQRYNGREASNYLRQKFMQKGTQVTTLQEFIDRIASRSSTTGNPYLIELTDGTTLKAKEWLEQQSQLLEAETHEKEQQSHDSVTSGSS